MTYAVGLGLCLLAGPLATLAQAPAPSSEAPMLVLAADPNALIASVGGQGIGPSFAPFGALAYGEAGLAEQLVENGAWWVTDGAWIARLCGVAL